MEVMIICEATPNPHAMRFVTNLEVNQNEGVTFISSNKEIELINELFKTDHVKEVYLFDNFITITKLHDISWDDLAPKIKESINSALPFHNPDINVPKKPKKVFEGQKGEAVAKIEEILNKKVRDFLRSDGGDLEIVDFEDNLLTIAYQGACGSCPSATAGTLSGIEGILQNEYDEKIKVKADMDQKPNDGIEYF